MLRRADHTGGVEDVSPAGQVGYPLHGDFGLGGGVHHAQSRPLLTGAEGVVESGGFLNAVGTYGMAIIAKACNKPFFALAESFKFLRMFPLNHTTSPLTADENLLAFPDLNGEQKEVGAEATPKLGSENREYGIMSKAQEALNPAIDYTTPDLVTFLFSDVGVLTPSGVGDALLAVYGGAD